MGTSAAHKRTSCEKYPERADDMAMNTKTKKILLACCLLVCCLLCSCAQNPTQEKLYAKLIGRFEAAGYTVSLSPVPDGQPVGIADASRWQQLTFAEGEEAVLVYFDESNRADYLKTFVDPAAFRLVTRFGQRFVLTYNGSDESVIALLREMDQ
jgi:hypothetical protein